MRTIYKYPIGTDRFTHAIPMGSKLLCVQVQKDVPFMWVEVDTDNELTEHVFYTYGTGHSMPHADSKYIGTFQLRGGALVFHVYGEAR